MQNRIIFKKDVIPFWSLWRFIFVIVAAIIFYIIWLYNAFVSGIYRSVPDGFMFTMVYAGSLSYTAGSIALFLAYILGLSFLLWGRDNIRNILKLWIIVVILVVVPFLNRDVIPTLRNRRILHTAINHPSTIGFVLPDGAYLFSSGRPYGEMPMTFYFHQDNNQFYWRNDNNGSAGYFRLRHISKHIPSGHTRVATVDLENGIAIHFYGDPYFVGRITQSFVYFPDGSIYSLSRVRLLPLPYRR